ncbi:MAG: hypothetical protein AB7O04_01455 [Hyphomonadaceae bacterium]
MAAAWLMAAPHAAAQTLAGGGSFEFPFIRLGLGLLLCTLVALLAALALKHLMTNGGAGLAGLKAKGLLVFTPPQIAVREAHRLSPHADICRLSYRDRDYVVIVSPGGAIVLREDASEPPPNKESGA